MKKIKLLCFFTILFSVISCNKDENPTSNADKVVGTYNGTLNNGAANLSCISKIIKTADTKVQLTIILGESSFVFLDISVINIGNTTYKLSYSEQSGYIDGKVEGNVLTYTLNSGVLDYNFIGTR
jgi:hypothetical protein